MLGTVVILDEIDSTNLYALRNLKTLPNMSVIFADSQTSGKGRGSHSWHSPYGNIYASFVLKNIKYPPPCAAFATCLAGLYTLRKSAPDPDFKIKLPNDIICGDSKIGGILCEFRKFSDGNALVAGIGLNVNADENNLREVGTKAASLFTLTGKKYDINQARNELINSAKYCFALSEDQIVSEFVKNCIMTGRQIAVQDSGTYLQGKLKAILSDGAAVINTSDGNSRKFYSGDFTLC